MTNQGFNKLGFTVLDRITDIFPSFAPKVFQKIFLAIFGAKKTYGFYLKKFRRQFLRTKKIESILLVVDINIGDAVIMQNGIDAIRYCYPDARIDYMCSKKGGGLISKLPAVDNIYDIFTGGGMPAENDLKKVEEIISANNYSVILNLSPFVPEKLLQRGANVILLIIPFTIYILHLWKVKAEQMNISAIIYLFLNDFLKTESAAVNSGKMEIVKKASHPWYKGNVVYISHDAVQTAKEFLFSRQIYSMDRLVLFNPDVTIKYSMIPFDTQVKVLKSLLSSGDIDYVLLTAAYFSKGIEDRIVEALPAEFWGKIIIVPHMPLDAYTALIDMCDVFLTGDTGTLHIAASWKEPLDSEEKLRNRTAVVSVIGPTDSRMFCYDSSKPGHMAAYQDAPSKVFAANSPCRNVTCLNKTVKTCKEVRCFANIDHEEISTYIVSYFRYLSTPLRKQG